MGYGQMIRAWREGKGLTQRQLAATVGCSDGYVAHIENEVKLPSLDIGMRLAQALELTPDEGRQLLEAVETDRQEQAERRMRTRSAALRGALLVRGGSGTVIPHPTPAPDEAAINQIAREIAADRDLLAAHHSLTTALSDPAMRETVLKALEAFALASRSRGRPPR